MSVITFYVCARNVSSVHLPDGLNGGSNIPLHKGGSEDYYAYSMHPLPD